MQGYHNLPEQTAEALEPDGWLHTGDIGEIDDEGFLRITDRKKDLIKTSGGKYVAPQAIERLFKGSCPLASQIVVHGDGRNYITALVTLDADAINAWAAHRGVTADYAELTRNPEVQAEVSAAIDGVNAQLNRWETVKKFAILDRDLTIEDGELTPSLKVKRKVVEQHYAEVHRGDVPRQLTCPRRHHAPRGRMAACPPPCPRGSRSRATGRSPRRVRRARQPPVRRLPARAVLRGALRLLRLQHLHGRRARRRRRRRRRTPPPPSPRCGWPAGCWATPTSAAATVFFGGGTPTLLPPRDLAQLLRRRTRRVRAPARRRGHHRGQPGQRRRGAPWRRCARPASPGCRSACSRRCRTCWPPSTAPTTPTGCRRPSRWARAAGFEGVSLDLIYGTPGESQDDWRASLEAAIGCAPDHVSAYALIVEEGTRLAAQVRRGEIAGAGRRRPRRPVPARRRAARRRRVRLVRGEQLGPRRRRSGPGTTRATGAATTGGASARARTATSAAPGGGTCGTPTAYAGRLAAGDSPAHAREVLTDEQRRVERVLLGIRLREGHPLADLRPAGRRAADRAVAGRPARPGRERRRPRSVDAARPSAGRCRGAGAGRLTGYFTSRMLTG